jgi:hypothetical protein
VRSVEDIRQRWSENALRMTLRPEMYAIDGRAYEGMARGLLSDLCFADERDAEFDRVVEELGRYGSLGVEGAFAALFGATNTYVAEVASVLAEQFHRLGYLPVNRRLDAAEWHRLTVGVRERIEGQDVRRSDITEAYGPPSLIVGRRVLCYAPGEGTGWVFFDCFAERTSRYVPEIGRYEIDVDADPLVRVVRRPAPSFEERLVLTRYGRVLRWGPGWWIRHSDGLTGEQQAIAAQLREIERSDPAAPVPARSGSVVWIFTGDGAAYPSAVFSDRESALGWTERSRVTGVLTEYPVGDGCYDLAVAEGRFRPSKPHHGTPRHVSRFSPGGDHIHIRDGRPDSDGSG